MAKYVYFFGAPLEVRGSTCRPVRLSARALEMYRSAEGGTAQAPEHYFFLLRFADRGKFPRGKDGRPARMAELGLLRFAEQEPAALRGMTFKGHQYRPSPGAWRQLELRVTPGKVRGYWDGECIGEVDRVLATDSMKGLRELDVKLLPGFPRPDLLKPNPGSVPRVLRETLGLYVHKGAASFREVVVEPLAEAGE